MINEDSPWYCEKTAARFLAVQGAYSIMFGCYSATDLDSLLSYLYEMREVLDLEKVDKKLLMKILKTVLDTQLEVDAMVSSHLNEKWSVGRLNPVAISIIRAAVCELMCSNVSENILINEYVNIASYTLEDSEVNFVNAILNKIKSVRAGDLYVCGGSDVSSEEGRLMSEGL